MSRVLQSLRFKRLDSGLNFLDIGLIKASFMTQLKNQLTTEHVT